MANVRKTQVMLIDEIVEVLKVNGTQEQIDFLLKKREQITNKNASKGLTAKQKENEITLEVIKEVLANCDVKVRINELQEKDERLAELSNQKISALLKKLVDNGEVVKTIEKKIAYFELA